MSLAINHQLAAFITKGTKHSIRNGAGRCNLFVESV